MKLKKFMIILLSFTMLMPTYAAYAETINMDVSSPVSDVDVEEIDNSQINQNDTEEIENKEDTGTSKDDNSVDRSDEKTDENKEANADKDKKSIFTISCNGDGYISVEYKGKDGKDNDNFPVTVDEKSEYKVKVDEGDVYEVRTYKSDLMDVNVDYDGLKVLKKKNAGINQIDILFKVGNGDAKFSADFKGNFENFAADEPAFFAARAVAKAANTKTINIKMGTTYWGYAADGSNPGPNMYGKFTSKTSGVYNGAVYCAEHDRAPTTGKRTGTVFTNTRIRKILYYGYRGVEPWSGFKTYKKYYIKNGSGKALDACGIVITGQALSNAYNKLGGKGTKTNRAGVSAFLKYIDSKPDPGASWTVYRVKTGGSTQDMMFGVYTPNGQLTMTKQVASNHNIVSECPEMYTLAGAEYTVKNSSGKVVGILTTKVDGSSNKLTLPVGTYTVKETKAPNGFAMDNKTYTVNVTSNKTATFTSKEVPLFDPVTIFLEKIAEDGKGSYVNKNADMSGAEFTVNYYDSFSEDITNISPKRTWKVTTKKHPTGNYVAMLREEYKLPDSDEFFKNETGREVIPRGQITIQETKAPHGYKVDPKVYKYKIEKDSADQLVKLNFGNTPEQPNSPLHPSIATNAIDVATGDRVGTNGKDVVIEDTVSYKELEKDHEYTVKGILMDKETEQPILVDGRQVTAEKTFVADSDNDGNLGNGAEGDVTLEYNFSSLDLGGKTVVCYASIYYEDEEIANHNDINAEEQSIHFPELQTQAKDQDTDSNLGITKEEEVIIDTVSYDNLIIGKTYTISGVLMDKDTEKPLLKKDGTEYTAETTFTAEETSGSVELTFVVDSSDLRGKTTVVFEDMYHNDKKVGTHSDITDEGQSIHYPDAHTNADIVEVGKDVGEILQIKDIFSYENLVAGKEYKVSGLLMCKETGKPLLVDGKEVTAEKTFVPEKTSGSVDVIFNVPAEALIRSDEGSSTVVFENLYLGDELVLSHEDIDDVDQTVSVGVMTVEYDDKTDGNPAGSNPATGDHSMLMMYILILAASGLTIASILKRRKEEE